MRNAPVSMDALLEGLRKPAEPLAVEPLLHPWEVAFLFRVDPATVRNWARVGKLHPVRTLGGQRRYRKAEVQALFDGCNTTHQN